LRFFSAVLRLSSAFLPTFASFLGLLLAAGDLFLAAFLLFFAAGLEGDREVRRFFDLRLLSVLDLRRGLRVRERRDVDRERSSSLETFLPSLRRISFCDIIA
jgi:hypothetical protein